MTTNIIIPTSEEDRKKIREAMKEISNSYLRVESEKDFVKEALVALEEAVGIPKKYLKKMSNIYHKQNMSELVSELEDLEALFESTK